MRPGQPIVFSVVAFLAACAFALLLLGRLAYPLIWQDEAQTAMLGKQVLRYGYPKVHGARHEVYDLSLPIEYGVRKPLDAFIVSPWLQFYWGAIGAHLAEGSRDPRTMTAGLRLPFALAGALGAVLPLALLLKLAGADRARRIGAAALYLVALATSISLVLHLREARWIPLATLELSTLVWIRAARMRGAIAPRRATVLETVLLVLLLHTFVPAFASAAIALTLDAMFGKRGVSADERLEAALPIAAAAIVGLPTLWFYETLSVSRAYAERAGSGIDVALSNLRQVLTYLLRYEWLAPALIATALRVAWSAGQTTPDGVGRVVRFLWILVTCHVALIAAIPWFFARYAVILSPFLTMVLVVELVAIETHLRGASRGRRWAMAAGFAALLAASMAMRAPEIAGRLHELREPSRGPLDFVIGHIRDRHPHPERLLIATNYEALVYAFYLDASVLDVGRLTGAPGADVIPDVIVPRRHWDENRRILRELLGRDSYETIVLPVRDRPTNTTPELGPATAPPRYRSFDDRPPTMDRERLEIYERVGQ